MQADRDRLYYYLNDYTILRHYIGDFEIGEVMNSPLREDYKPSFQVKVSDSERVYWVDYGIHQDRFDAIEYVSLRYDISRDEAIDKIWKELVLGGVEVVQPPDHTVKKFSIPYDFKYRDMTNKEYSYWYDLGISKGMLNLYNIHALESLSRIGVELLKSTDDEPAFIYLFDSPTAFKSYKPGGGIWKWRGQDNGLIIEGYKQLREKDDILIITSSLKDTLVMQQAGYSACNPTSENSFNTLVGVKEELEERFKKIYIFFDNDSPGVKAALKLKEATGWAPIGLPIKWGCKDPSDLISKDKGDYKRLKIFLEKVL